MRLPPISRRSVMAGGLGLAATRIVPAGAQQAAITFGPPELIEAAKKEGTLIYYTANFTEIEQEVIKAFNKRVPFVKVELAGSTALPSVLVKCAVPE